MKKTCWIGLSLPLLALAFAGCSGGVSSSSSGAGGDTSSTSSSGGAGSTASAGGAGSTASIGGAGSTASAGGAGSTASIGGAGGMTGAGGALAGSGGAGGGSANAIYSAQYWPGGLDHIFLWKADTTSNRCFEVHVAWPSMNQPGFNVTLPAMWGVVNAMVTDDAQDCAPNMSPMGQTFNATSAMGTIDWTVQPGMYAPCTIDFQIDLAFAGAPGWAPATEPLNASMVTVQGGCI